MSIFRFLIAGLQSLPGWLLVQMVYGYQLFLSPLFGGHCRFYPSCSNYFIQAVHKHGAMRGTLKGLARICRCHPFHPGGYDPP